MKYITNNFRTHIAKQFVESIDEVAPSIYYLGAHRSLAFPNDASPPDPNTSQSGTHYRLYDDLVFGKHVTSNDVAHMIRNIPWVANTVYEMYDDNLESLDQADFFVVSPESGNYHVFKCLNNAGGAASTSQPLRSEVEPEDDFYRKDDGYEWKYMFTIDGSVYQKFATALYVPIQFNTDVQGYAVDGSIDTLIIDAGGTTYSSYATGNIKEAAVAGNNLIFSLESDTVTLSANDSFYENCSIYIDEGPGDGEIRTIVDYFTSGGERRVLVDHPFNTLPSRDSSFKIAPRVIISGDGQNALARAEVSNGVISEVNIIQRGSNYTFANVEVVGNTGTVGSATTSAIVRATISPPGGHGSDPINELYAHAVGISVAFIGTEASTIPVGNDYRTVTLIKDPKFEKAILNLNSTSETFTAGETIVQATTGASGKIVGRNSNNMTLTEITGFFVPSSLSDANTCVVGITSAVGSYINTVDRQFATFDQRYIYQAEITYPGLPVYSGFIEDEQVVQSGLLEFSNDIVRLTLANTAYTFIDGELVTQANTGATGVVSRRFENVLTLANTNGFFVVNTAITGATSNTAINVLAYDATFEATAAGYIHEIVLGANNAATIALTSQQGTFLLSDDLTNTINTFTGQTSQAIAKLNGLDTSKNRLVDGSGEIIYVENMIPISRDEDQAERIKLVIEF